nr:hypothetical protein [Pseudoalteromonas sp. WY3]
MKPSIVPKNKTLNCLFLLSLIFVLVITFFSTKIPLLVSFGQEIEVLIFRLSLSFLASYVFYFVVVHYKSYRDKKNLYPYVKGYTASILDKYEGLFNALKAEAYNDYEKHTYKTLNKLSIDSIEETLLLIDVRTSAPLVSAHLGRKLNWMEYLVYTSNEIEKSINDLLLVSSHLDSELIKILFHIRASLLFKLSRNLSSNLLSLKDNNFALNKKIFMIFIFIVSL